MCPDPAPGDVSAYAARVYVDLGDGNGESNPAHVGTNSNGSENPATFSPIASDEPSLVVNLVSVSSYETNHPAILYGAGERGDRTTTLIHCDPMPRTVTPTPASWVGCDTGKAN